MNNLPSSTEDIFVREMIVHGNKERAIRAAFPRMVPEFIPAAIEYMMENPEIRHRIDAGILYFYKGLVSGTLKAEMEPVSLSEKRELLHKIILRRRRHPAYVRTDEGLRMVMVSATSEEVNDAVRMERELRSQQMNSQRK